MARSLTTLLLALGIAATTLAGTAPAQAASSSGAGTGAAERSQARLIRRVTGFGYALLSGSHRQIDRYATPAVLRSAPGRHVLNLLPPAGRHPRSFTFRITRFSGATGAVTLQLTDGGVTRTTATGWTDTGAGWKLVRLGQVGSIPAGLVLAHGAPANGMVDALLIGKSFVPTERVHITYTVTVRTVSTRTLQLAVTADRFGAFAAPLKFDLGSPSYGYTITATAVGEAGDRATLTTWASGQTR
jgi:hypothetical protein